MALKDLLPELLQLNRDEMIQAVEILKRQINSTVAEPTFRPAQPAMRTG